MEGGREGGEKEVEEKRWKTRGREERWMEGGRGGNIPRDGGSGTAQSQMTVEVTAWVDLPTDTSSIVNRNPGCTTKGISYNILNGHI